MIQKFQTYFTRFINYLENNSDTRLFKTYLKNNEDLELKKIYMQVNHLNGLLRSYLDKISKELNLWNFKFNSNSISAVINNYSYFFIFLV